MALIRPGGGVGQASGSLGSIVFSHNRAGQYVRARSRPVQPRGEYQMDIRNAVSAASAHWKGLVQSTQEAWKAWAQANPVANRLGDRIRLQGNAAYVLINARQFLMNWEFLEQPPVTAAPKALQTMVFTASHAGASEIVYTDQPLGVAEHLYVRGALLTSIGQRFVTNKLRLLGQSPAAGTGTWDYKSVFEGRLGYMAVGMAVALNVAVYDHLTGLMSTPQCGIVVVGA